MQLPNESASLVFVLFCLFSFRTNLWPHVLTKNTGKAFIHVKKINCLVTTLNEVFNRLKAFLFIFFIFGESTRESKENTFCTIREQVFLLAHGSHHNVEIAEKLGKRVKKSEKFNTRISMTTISWSRMKTKPGQRHDLLFCFFKRFWTSIHLLAKLDTIIVDGE